MSDQNSQPDWLPAGWIMEVRVRKNGKKDKCYTDPSNELKFYSKPEVLRYLSNVANDQFKSEENKSSQKQSAANFVVEKVVAEGLPPGWTKEMRIKKKGRKIRRDPYYIDPTNKHVFRSMKEVFRYLENGELGSPASKQREEGCISVELGDNSPVEAEGKKLADSATPLQVHGNQGLKWDVVDSEHIQESSYKEDSLLTSKNTSDMCEASTVTTCANLCETNESGKKEEKDNSLICKIDPAPEVCAPQEKLPSGNELQRNEDGKTQHGSRKLKNKRGSDVPRRTSKRLAGIKVDPPLELKTNSHTCQVAAATKLSGDAETSSVENPIDLGNSKKCVKRMEVEKTSDEKQGCSIVLPNEHSSTPEVHTGLVESNDKGDERPDTTLNLSSRESWMDVDPCIEFAIKTLTGAFPIGDDNRADENPGTLQKLPGKNTESPSDLSLGFLWADPCIEFAVKTLTGEIPVQDCFQKQVTSSKAQGQNELALPTASLDHFHRADFSSQHFQVTEKPPHKQEAVIIPTLPHTGNILSRNSTSTELYQHIGGRTGGYPRTTMI